MDLRSERAAQSPRTYWPLLAAFILAAAKLGAAELSWIRVLAGDAAPTTWRSGEPMPSRVDGSRIDPRAVLSYTSLKPGLDLDDGELAERAVKFERALAECGRFGRAAVYVVEAGELGDARGLVAEVEENPVPGFGGGAAYGSVRFALLHGARADLEIAAGPNKAGLWYSNGYARGTPLIAEAYAAYSNDLLEDGPLSSHEAGAGAAIGLRLGPLAGVVAGPRVSAALDAEGEIEAVTAVDIDLFALSLGAGPLPLDLEAMAQASYYPASSSVRALSVASLRVGARASPGGGVVSLVAATGAGWSSGGVPESEYFEFPDGPASLRGPDFDMTVGAFALGSLEAEAKAAEAALLPWLRASAGPFAFVDAAVEPSGGLRYGAGGGVRICLGSPVGVTVDLGYAVGGSGSGCLVFSVASSDVF